MDCVKNLICDPALRLQRKAQKEQALLHFLRQHIWSTQDILQQVMQLMSRQAAHKTLLAMEKQGYLRRHVYDALGGKLTIWGITHQGQAIAFDVHTEALINVCFEPMRVSEQTIRHQLDLQKLRLIAERYGWTQWVDGDRLGKYDKNQKRPDAIVQNMQGKRIAIECERTLKSIKRYEQILIEYLRLIKTGAIHHVVWVCPTEDMALRIKKILTSITSVRVQGTKVMIEPDKHHTHLHFCAYEVWPHYG